MSRWFTGHLNGKASKETSAVDNSVVRSSLSLTSLLQVFCKGCEELDKRCLARLIIAPELPLNAARTNRKAVELHQDFTELEACAERGCYSCRLWRRSLLGECYSDDTILSLQQSAHSVLALPPAGTTRPWIITIETKTFTGKSLSCRILLDNATFIPAPIVPKLQSWYLQCHRRPDSNEAHWKCFKHWESSKAERQSFRPRRLLDLKQIDGGAEAIRLVPGDEMKINERYVALSYCWGTSENCKTTEGNEAQHKARIGIKDLPKTIRDAVNLCRDLEIYYLWVDALCILQDHSSAEWSKEASRIDKIYGFATFTLAITSSRDSNEGFLQKRDQDMVKAPATEKATMAYHRIQLAPKTLQEIKERAPLDSRGWAFQEERLSPRIVYWTAYGIFWTCLSGSCSEMDAGLVPDRTGHSLSHFEDFTDPSYQELGEGVIKSVQTNRLWSRLIEAYSPRKFTRIEDRLPALSGLAKKYSRETNSQYIAGHWLNTLQSDLLWIVAPGSLEKSDGKTVSKLEIAPSWSWASIPPSACVLFPRRYGRSTSRLVDYDIQRASEDDFGAISSARICVEARLRPLLQGETRVEWPEHALKDESGHPIFPSTTGIVYSLDPKSHRILVSHNAAYPIIIQTDCNIPSCLENCYCLDMNRNGFLLLQKLDKSNNYKRIGCAQWYADRNFFDNSDVVRVNLI